MPGHGAMRFKGGRSVRGEREKGQAGAPWVQAPRWSSAAASVFMAAGASAAAACKCSAPVFWASLASNGQARAALDRAVAARASAVMKGVIGGVVDFHVRAARGRSREERRRQWAHVARVARRQAAQCPYCVTAPELEGEVETVRSRLALSKPGGE